MVAVQVSAPEPKTTLDLLKEGDPTAQREFWRQQHEIIFRICEKVLRDPAEAADVADEVLVEFLFRWVHRVETGGALVHYLKLMAVRRALRRKKRRGLWLADDPTEAAIDESARDEDRALAKLIFPRIEGCLPQLTSKARQALRLRFAVELTNEAIGDLIGGSKQYIGRLLTQSLEVLRRCVESRAGQEASANG